jgi:hypothetical protein
MCRYWKINKRTYSRRLKNGQSVADALSIKTKASNRSKSVTDHLGNEFPSISAMCRHYNTNSSSYKYKLDKGLSLEEALTKSSPMAICVTDHLGNKFPSISAMCKYWNISDNSYKKRMHQGWTMKDALTKTVYTNVPIIDLYGNEFSNIKSICAYYNLSIPTYKARLRNNYSQIECLGIIPCINSVSYNLKIIPNLTIIKNIVNDYYLCNYQNHEVALLKDDIIEFATEYLKSHQERR